MADELARQARLRAQLEHPISPNPYALRLAPLGLRVAPELSALREGWASAKARAAAGQRSPSEQRDLVWFALHVAEAERLGRDLVAARAALETALELLEDAGHRHLVHCRLVTEAVRDRDPTSAERWLLQCDPRTEVLELDNSHRKAVARLRAAGGDHAGVLAVVGEREGDVAIVDEYAAALALLRAGAHEALGRESAADAAVETACGVGGEEPTLAKLAELGLAPRATARRRRARVEAAASARDAIPVGARALDDALFSVPILAGGLLFLVTIPRCTFDADPFFGVQGDLLCPHACRGCEGPFRLYTEWTHNGSEHSTNGPRYFCRTADNGVATMSDADFAASLHKLDRYELTFAPAAATYLTLLALLLPLALWSARTRHLGGVGARAAADEELSRLAADAGIEAPPATARHRSWVGFKLFAAALAVPSLVIALELALR